MNGKPYTFTTLLSPTKFLPIVLVYIYIYAYIPNNIESSVYGLSYKRTTRIYCRSFQLRPFASVLSPGTCRGNVEVSGNRKNGFLSRVIFIRLGKIHIHTLAYTNRLVSLAVSSFFSLKLVYIYNIQYYSVLHIIVYYIQYMMVRENSHQGFV